MISLEIKKKMKRNQKKSKTFDFFFNIKPLKIKKTDLSKLFDFYQFSLISGDFHAIKINHNL